MSEENVDAIRAALEASTGVLSVFEEKAGGGGSVLGIPADQLSSAPTLHAWQAGNGDQGCDQQLTPALATRCAG
jgi:hypothetical protein